MSGPVVAVVGGCGGAGGSMVAAGLALAVAGEGGVAVLVDLDPVRGDQAGMLGAPPLRTTADLVPVAAALGDEHLRAAAHPHPSGIGVVAGGPLADDAVAALVAGIAAVPDPPVTVLDLGSGAGSAARAAAAALPTVLVVPLDAPGVRVAGRTRRLLGDDVVVVANAGARRRDVSPRAAGRAVGAGIAAVLPRDDRTALAVAVGVLPSGRRAPLAGSLHALAASVGLVPEEARP